MLTRNLHVEVKRTTRATLPGANEPGRTRSLLADYAPVNIVSGNSIAPVRRPSSGISAEDAARKIVALCLAGKAAPGDSFSILLDAEDRTLARFPGAAQRHFLAAGHGLDDLKAGLDHAVERGWLAEGRRAGIRAEMQSYVITQAAIDVAASNKE